MMYRKRAHINTYLTGQTFLSWKTPPTSMQQSTCWKRSLVVYLTISAVIKQHDGGSRHGSRHGTRYGTRHGTRHGSRQGSRQGSRHGTESSPSPLFSRIHTMSTLSSHSVSSRGNVAVILCFGCERKCTCTGSMSCTCRGNCVMCFYTEDVMWFHLQYDDREWQWGMILAKQCCK